VRSGFFFLFFFLVCSLFSNFEIEYNKKLELTANKIEKVILLNDFSEKLQEYEKFNEAMDKAKSALTLAKTTGFVKGIAISNNNIGHILYSLEKYNDAITYFKKSLKYRGEINDKLVNDNLIFLGKSYYMLKYIDRAMKILNKVLLKYKHKNNKIKLAETLNLLGDIFLDKGDFDNALNNYFEALRIFERKKYRNGMANSYISIGIVFYSNKEYRKAEKYFLSAYNISKINNYKLIMVDALSSLGSTYEKTKLFSKAIDKYREAYKIANDNNDKYQMAIIMNNLGEVYRNRGGFKDALSSYKEAYNLFNQLGDKLNSAVCYINIGLVYLDKKQPKSAINYLNESLKVIENLKIKDLIKIIYKSYSETYAMLRDYKSALKYHKLYMKVKDEIFTETGLKNMAEIQTKYETEKKENRILLLSKEQEKAKIIKNSLYIGLGMLFILVFLIFNRYRIKTKAHKALTAAHKKLETASEEISKQRDKIVSSIKYAERIQKAILPLNLKINRAFPENFILFLPKDIVSGDFYWFAETENAKFISAIDCTGHGVPGAFMSMIGYSLLNQIVNEYNKNDPADILEELSLQVKSALKQESDSDTRDGMDMAFCKIESLNGKIKLTFAGAKRPLYIVRNNSEDSLIELKGDRKSIGGYQKKKKEPFKNKEIVLSSGDMIYLTSDGYADQHNENEKKFSSKRMRELFVKIFSKPVDIQRKILYDNLQMHKNGAEQQDDITVIGIRV